MWLRGKDIESGQEVSNTKEKETALDLLAKKLEHQATTLYFYQIASSKDIQPTINPSITLKTIKLDTSMI